ncbi:MAG TPA: hypothetical protein VJX30_08370 [Terriglobales bacterium]|nr:hypothetical protein [Terriglobales bacterium]
MANGDGSDKIYVSKADTAALPARIAVTDATGRVNSLPALDIHVGGPALVDKNVFSVAVGVKTSGYVEPGTPYKAAVLLFGKNPAEAPTAIKIKIEDDAVVSFDASQTNIVTALDDAKGAHQRVRVRNTGKATITLFEVTSSVLSDAANAHRVQMNKFEKGTQLSPGQSMDVDFDLPQPAYAGSYTGNILIIANRSFEKSIAITIQTRGPLSSKHVPLAIFALVVIFGFTISSVLDSWFVSGGLARAQAYISLKQSEMELANQLDNINTWRSKVPGVSPLLTSHKQLCGLPRRFTMSKCNGVVSTTDELTAWRQMYRLLRRLLAPQFRFGLALRTPLHSGAANHKCCAPSPQLLLRFNCLNLMRTSCDIEKI